MTSPYGPRELILVSTDVGAQWLPKAAPEQSSASAEDIYFDELYDWLECLTPKQRFVITLRCGLRDGTSYTVREIGTLMGISHQSVARIESRARTKLRVTMGVDKPPVWLPVPAK